MQGIICLSQGVGNVIMATPAIRAVHSLGYEVDVFCNARFQAADLLRGWNCVRRIYTTLGDLRLIQTRYDVACRGVWCDLAWPPAEIAARDYLSPDVLDLREHHESEANLTVARKMGYRGAMPPAYCGYDLPADWQRSSAGADNERAAPHPRPLSPGERGEAGAALCPGYGSHRSHGWDRKLWPHWKELIGRLSERGDPIVVLGGAGERTGDRGRLTKDEGRRTKNGRRRTNDEGRRTKVASGSSSVFRPSSGVLDLRGRLTLRQAAGVLARAAHVVSIDNGLAHVAAAVGAPVTVLFGFTSPVKNRPLGPHVRVLTAGLGCQPCQMTPRERTCTDPICMRGISVDQVLEAVG